MNVIDIDEINIVSINDRFMKARSGRFFLNPKYRRFKDTLVQYCREKNVKPPYRISIRVQTATDIDNVLKAILDALQTRGVITDDAQVHELHVFKKPIKRKQMGSVSVDVEAIPETSEGL